MSTWHVVWSEGDTPRLLCGLCMPTTCPACQSDTPCRGGVHSERPVRLQGPAGEVKVPAGANVIWPENMGSAGFARLEAMHYRPGALGAGSAGPASIESLVGFSRELDGKLRQDGETLAVLCSEGACANVMLLLAGYLMLAQGLSAEKAYSWLPKMSPLRQRFPAPWARLPLWHAYSLTVWDCLEGLEAAKKYNWFDYQGFDGVEWRRLLKTYDASFAFHIPQEDHNGEPRRLNFYAMADPVTTVADPSVRPAPPEDGFVNDYVNMPRGVRYSHGWDRSAFSSEPSPTSKRLDFERHVTEPDRPGVAEMWSDELALSRSTLEKERRRQSDSDAPVDRSFSDTGANEVRGTIRGVVQVTRRERFGDLPVEDGFRPGPLPIEEDIAEAIVVQSMPSGAFSKRGLEPDSGAFSVNPETFSRVQVAKALGSGSPVAYPGAGGSPSSANKSSVTWLETVRVRRWGQEQHSRQSNVPVGLVKERGLTTLPEFSTWLRSVGCQRLVQLNSPDETNLPPSGSYMDYFTQWQLKQEQLFFADGSAPPLQVVRNFRTVVERAMDGLDDKDSPTKVKNLGGAIVVHCTAGLGRTGTLLGSLAIDLTGVSGGAWMGWLRMCRPGSVQTLAQETFLKTYPKVEAIVKPKRGCLSCIRPRGQGDE